MAINFKKFIERLDEIKKIYIDSANDIKAKLNMLKFLTSKNAPANKKTKELKIELEEAIQELIISLSTTSRTLFDKKNQQEKLIIFEIFCYDLLVALIDSANDIKTKLNILKILILEKNSPENKDKKALKIELEETIQELIISLRKTLEILFNNECKQKNPTVLETFCYDLLVVLTALRPRNKYDPETKKFIDPISLAPIEENNKVITSCGYLFDINTLITHFNKKNKALNPIDGKEFSRLDQKEILSQINKKNSNHSTFQSINTNINQNSQNNNSNINANSYSEILDNISRDSDDLVLSSYSHDNANPNSNGSPTIDPYLMTDHYNPSNTVNTSFSVYSIPNPLVFGGNFSTHLSTASVGMLEAVGTAFLTTLANQIAQSQANLSNTTSGYISTATRSSEWGFGTLVHRQGGDLLQSSILPFANSNSAIVSQTNTNLVSSNSFQMIVSQLQNNSSNQNSNILTTTQGNFIESTFFNLWSHNPELAIFYLLVAFAVYSASTTSLIGAQALSSSGNATIPSSGVTITEITDDENLQENSQENPENDSEEPHHISTP